MFQVKKIIIKEPLRKLNCYQNSPKCLNLILNSKTQRPGLDSETKAEPKHIPIV